ncbi:hypothetical protein JEP1_026 [Escherichia phage JEP1]|uniref:Uncharacterized protein n=1 Tax=Escherichia phage JEP1 TaxID=2759218 RepID=A0A7S6HUW0_9CAUD|nr:hypothetical protein JEP1_026 [Escherichia phage JEP1]
MKPALRRLSYYLHSIPCGNRFSKSWRYAYNSSPHTIAAYWSCYHFQLIIDRYFIPSSGYVSVRLPPNRLQKIVVTSRPKGDWLISCY